MTSVDQKRAEILDRLADHVLAHGLAASSLRPLAAAAGTSDRMLIYYFKDKAGLVAAVLQHVALRLAGELEAMAATAPASLEVLRGRLFEILVSEALWPYMRLWLEIAAAAARGDAVCRQVGEAIGRGFLAWGTARLESPSPAERDR
ncbi:MAG TPA: TetR/AcrR family transcriptional regulator, partial [Caulobacteraceae bacterium]